MVVFHTTMITQKSRLDQSAHDAITNYQLAANEGKYLPVNIDNLYEETLTHSAAVNNTSMLTTALETVKKLTTNTDREAFIVLNTLKKQLAPHSQLYVDQIEKLSKSYNNLAHELEELIIDLKLDKSYGKAHTD